MFESIIMHITFESQPLFWLPLERSRMGLVSNSTRRKSINWVDMIYFYLEEISAFNLTTAGLVLANMIVGWVKNPAWIFGNLQILLLSYISCLGFVWTWLSSSQ